jgi:hypothetical protein
LSVIDVIIQPLAKSNSTPRPLLIVRFAAIVSPSFELDFATDPINALRCKGGCWTNS